MRRPDRATAGRHACARCWTNAPGSLTIARNLLATAPPDSLQPHIDMNPFTALRDAWFFYSRHFAFLLRLCLPLILVESAARLAADRWLASSDPAMRDLLLGLLFYPLYTAALIRFAVARNAGEQPPVAALLEQALQRWLPMALLVGLVSLAIMLGASLFVVPGLYLMVKLAFAEYLLVERGATPLAALKGSFVLTRGHFLPLLSTVLMVMLPLWLLDAWSHQAFADPATPLPLRMALDGGLGLLQLYGTLVFFRLYMLARPA